MAKMKDQAKVGKASPGKLGRSGGAASVVAGEVSWSGRRARTEGGSLPGNTPRKRSKEKSHRNSHRLDDTPTRPGKRKGLKSANGESPEDMECAGSAEIDGTRDRQSGKFSRRIFRRQARSQQGVEMDPTSPDEPSIQETYMKQNVPNDSEIAVVYVEEPPSASARSRHKPCQASVSRTEEEERVPRFVLAQKEATGAASRTTTAEQELFSSSDSEDGATPSGGLRSRQIDTIAINKAYAEAYEVRKRREFLQKNKELLLEDSDESRSSSEEEDEDAVMLSDKVECKILDTLARIKNKDPSVYDTNHKFFDDDDFHDTQTADTRPGKGTRYSDLVREVLSDRGPTAFLEEEDALAEKKQETEAPTYNGELSALRRAFIDAAEGIDADGVGDGFLESKQKTKEELADEETEYRSFLKSKAGNQQVDHNAALSRYWAADESLGPDERFLRDYILHQGWREDRAGAPMENPGLQKFDEEDELNMDQTEAFEAAYNFRYEEEGGLEIQGHARKVEGSVRQKNDKRRRQREAKKARLAEEKAQREKELKRLKALKKKEIMERIQKIQEITGHAGVDVSAVDLEADFDPETHDKAMESMLGEDYDDHEETADPKQLLRVPLGFEETLGVPTEQDATNSKPSKKQRRLEKLLEKRERLAVSNEEAYAPLPEGEEHFAAPRAHKEAVGPSGVSQADDVGEWWMCDGCGSGIPGGKKRFDCTTCENFTFCKQCFRSVRHPHQLVKKTVPRHCKPPEGYQDGFDKSSCLESYLDECLQPDYEDIIGKDLPTRFKYTTVTPNDYGMSVEEVLSRTDKELNAIVSLKKLAPYRDSELDSRKRLRRVQFRLKHQDKFYQGKASDHKDCPDSRVTEFGITQARLRAYGD